MVFFTTYEVNLIVDDAYSIDLVGVICWLIVTCQAKFSIQQPVKQEKQKYFKKTNNENEQLPPSSLKFGTDGCVEQSLAPIKDLFSQ